MIILVFHRPGWRRQLHRLVCLLLLVVIAHGPICKKLLRCVLVLNFKHIDAFLISNELVLERWLNATHQG